MGVRQSLDGTAAEPVAGHLAKGDMHNSKRGKGHVVRCLLIGGCALLCTYMAWRAGRSMHRQQVAFREAERLGLGVAHVYVGPRWLRSWMLQNGATILNEIVGLDFSRATISDGDLAIASDLPSLRTLTLDGTAITDAGLLHLNGLPQLSTLGLAGTAITDEGVARVAASLPRLSCIDLSATRISDDAILHLASMPALFEVDLRETGVSDAGLRPLTRARTLRYLDLSHTEISDSAAICLEECTWLRRITLRGTRMTAEGIARLKNALPEAAIEVEE